LRLLVAIGECNFEHDVIATGREPHQLQVAGELGRQFGQWEVFEENAEHPLAKRLGEQEFTKSSLGREPSPGDEKHHDLAARGGLPEGILPALACRDPARRIEVDEQYRVSFQLLRVSR